ncbi:ScyD/ScyE family protein [Mycetocola manganoxydans]|uniref:ScyD/ScyE family protein n=1 Tax=Mycetocola manganoxydans TaxID=699879 RepID=UPI0015FF6D81|nr:ScyD/ScyE family protein [Mycetocola manganoxydans]GHD39729.1 hypothetical protein GCM10008097_02820 [Mycetocola manganoxydans]
MKSTTLSATVCAAVIATVAIAAPASAHGGKPPVSISERVIADGLLSPLSLDVDHRGNAYVTQNFSGVLTKVPPRGSSTTIASGNGDEIGAVSTRGDTVYYVQASQDEAHSRATLMRITKRGAPTAVADLRAFEDRVNPDGVNTYGFTDLPESCASQFDPNGPFGAASYTGILDTHAYASLALKDGVYIADAGMNAIIKVGHKGRISTVAVLPPMPPITISAELAEQAGFPECAVGYGYRFEPVPTDVEVGPGGWLYVTALPGGPEDASLGMRGMVYKVNPWNGKVVTHATGFVGATGLAVSQKTGVVFVAEMFGGPDGTGQVSVVLPWSKQAVASFPVTSPAAIELSGRSIYLTKDAFVMGAEGPQAIGKVVKVSLKGKWMKSYLG